MLKATTRPLYAHIGPVYPKLFWGLGDCHGEKAMRRLSLNEYSKGPCAYVPIISWVPEKVCPLGDQ